MNFADYYKSASQPSQAKTPNQLAAQQRSQFDDRSLIGLSGRQRAMYDMLGQGGDYTKANSWASGMHRRTPSAGDAIPPSPGVVTGRPPMVPYGGQMQGNFTTGGTDVIGWGRRPPPQMTGRGGYDSIGRPIAPPFFTYGPPQLQGGQRYAAGVPGGTPGGTPGANARPGSPRMTYQQYLRWKQQGGQRPGMLPNDLDGADFLFGGYRDPSHVGNPYLPAMSAGQLHGNPYAM